LTISEAGGPENQALGYLPADNEWRAPHFYEDTAMAYKGDKLGLSLEGASLPEHQTWFFYLQLLVPQLPKQGLIEIAPVTDQLALPFFGQHRRRVMVINIARGQTKSDDLAWVVIRCNLKP